MLLLGLGVVGAFVVEFFVADVDLGGRGRRVGAIVPSSAASGVGVGVVAAGESVGTTVKAGTGALDLILQSTMSRTAEP